MYVCEMIEFVSLSINPINPKVYLVQIIHNIELIREREPHKDVDVKDKRPQRRE